ncbi:MAG: hypothetical protein IME96_02520 [Proteobacteria bacterium]|nr:hypothetical protein [Pseudomonadota bacterium]
MLTNHIYYYLRPLIPRSVQIFLRRQFVIRRRMGGLNNWPIDEKAGERPEGFTGWPEGKKFAIILTHDIEMAHGHDRCKQLAAIEEEMGFRSSFNFVPKRYDVSPELRKYLTDKDFEIGVHGLYHDGKLYRSKKIFMERAKEINGFIKEWNVTGFRSPSMHNNLEWIQALDIEYDASTFDTDPFEPKSEGVATIFPFRVSSKDDSKGYIELPYTLPQDFTLFVMLQEKTIDIWKRKLDWVAEKGGMALITTHPDYMCFDGKKPSVEEYPAEYYREFLEYIKSRYEGQYWQVLPRDLATYWKSNVNATMPPKHEKRNL